MKRILILNANQRSALSVTRSLGRHNVPLITADETPDSLAGSSCYSQKYFKHPSPQQQPENFILVIAEICKKETIDIVMPMTELTATLLLNAQDNLPDITLPFADIKIIDTLADKCSLMRLAEELNIPFPKTWHANDPFKLPFSLNKLSYPLVLKPGRSWVNHDGEWIHTTVQIAKTPAEANNILTTDPAFLACPFMLQEFIPGKGAGVFAIYDNTKPLAFFAHRRLREKPPQGGVSVLSESIETPPPLKAYSQLLLDHVGWHGVAMVEFRVTPDGEPYLMEINTRFWGSLQLAVDAGVDFPWLLYQSASGQQTSTVGIYKTGIRLRWILGDLDSLYLTLRDKNIAFNKRLKAVLTFLQPHPLITKHEVNRWKDMKPFYWEIKNYIRDILAP